MRMKLFTSVAFAALVIPGAAYAQSTGSVDFDNDIIVTGNRATGVAGVELPDTTKARGALNQEFIARQTPGNSILDTINQLPGVSFQNNDPFGSAGGTLTVRGFDSTRIALTFDGIPLNDTGNYALYSNQQLDPELIEQINVSYGSADIDTPSAAASGSTINYRTRNPSKEFAARMVASVGDFNYFRIFGVVDTGEFTPWGTTAWFSASSATNNWYVNDFGKVEKQQYNGKIYQPIGSNGDFISVAANYNENRNNFGGSAPLRYDANRTPGTGINNRFPLSMDEIPYHIARCQIAPGVNGVSDAPVNINDPSASNNGTACGASFDERYNPSNTGSIRINSKFTLADGLVLTIDPSFQYTKANGGGTVTASEYGRDIDPSGGGAANCLTTPTGAGVLCRTGFFGGSPYAGIDLNGDGDLLDRVNVLAPSQTQTRRYGVNASLRYDINDSNTVRVSYSFDRGRHRQTGEADYLRPNGVPYDVFPVNDPIIAASGAPLQKRDRLSYATLNQIAGEYRGEFGNLSINVGLTEKFLSRDLTNYCFSSSASGFVECFGRDATLQNEIASRNPTWAAPQNRMIRYNRLLPSGGISYKFDGFTAFVNYSKGIQVPGTDNLYNSFFFAADSDAAHPTPETTDNFDAGLRYTSSKLQFSVGPWYTRFTNRLASAFDPITDTTVYRNLGRVDKYGVDADLDWRPIPELLVHVFGSYLKSEIKNDVQIGECTNTTAPGCTTLGQPIYAATAGKRESGAPVYTLGGRVQGTLGPLDLGVQAKRTGKRYLNDQNLPLMSGTTSSATQVYYAATPEYTLVDADARLNMEWTGIGNKTYLQVNVQNIFNQYYVGGFTGGATSNTSIPFVQIGTPRTFIATLNVAF